MSDLQKTAQALATALITEGVLDKPAIEKYYGGGYSTTQLHFGNLYADALSQAAVEKLAQAPDQFEQVMTRFAQGAVQLNDTEFSVAIGNLKRDMVDKFKDVPYEASKFITRKHANNRDLFDINTDAKKQMALIFSANPEINKGQVMDVVDILSGMNIALIREDGSVAALATQQQNAHNIRRKSRY